MSTGEPLDSPAQAPLELTRGGMRFSLAGVADDEDLRALLRGNPMPGRLSLTLEREPSFFHGAGLEGDRHESVIAREIATGEAIGLCSRAVRTAFINGEERELGYLSQLRVKKEFRERRGVVPGGFALCKKLHDQEAVPLYVTTIVEDNLVARRLLEAGLPGLPTYRKREVLETLAMPLWRRRRVSARGLELRAARPDDLPEISALLLAHYRNYQFAPRWTLEALTHPERSRGLKAEDFTLAIRGKELVGCVSLWDQEAYKQSVIRGYGPALSRIRPALNLFAPVLNLPRLPRVGERLRHAFLAHLAVVDEDPAVARALLLTAANRSLKRRYAYLTMGIAERHPLASMVRSTFRPISYRSMLYALHWDDGAAAAEALDDRVPHLEVAVL